MKQSLNSRMNDDINKMIGRKKYKHNKNDEGKNQMKRKKRSFD